MHMPVRSVRRFRMPGVAAAVAVALAFGALPAAAEAPDSSPARSAPSTTSEPDTTYTSIPASPKRTLRILVTGDSYSAGNGAGHYYGAKGCYRSTHNYAAEFAAHVRHSGQPAIVTNVACSGAVTADYFHSNNGRPPELDGVNHSYDVIFVTIGGNDANFSDIVKYCLIAKTRDGANCGPLLRDAQQMLDIGTVEARLRKVLTGIRHRAFSGAKIVLLGYPMLEGDAGYTLRSGHGDNAPIIAVGARLHRLQIDANKADAAAVAYMNAHAAGSPFVFVNVQPLFNGPPFHGLYAKKNNPDRWMVQPFVDASLATYRTWYHPNPTGWAQEGKLLFDTPAVPRVAVPRVTIAAVDQGGVPETPTTIAIPGFVSMSMAFLGSYVLKSNGKVYPMGGANGLKVLPTPVAGLPDITQIDGASGIEYALAANGYVYAWTIRTEDTATNRYSAAEGQQGNGSTTPSFTPVQVADISTAIAIAANVNTGYALLADGTVMAWGGNDVGELGDGQSGTAQQFVTVPQPVTGVSGATALSGGWQGAFALTGTAIREWGCDAAKSYVSWDAGGPYITDTPVRLSGLPAVSAVSAGQGAGFALTPTGTVWSWGDNSDDATGQGDNTFSWHKPARIRTLPAIRSLTATSRGGAAVSTTGRLYVWGGGHAPHLLAGIGTVSRIGAGGADQLWALLA
jgi:hypothetical protein